ncbi:hypothetical protein SJ05684_c35930 [Sinorhizobium sojae CCBAU 05684]|uniref:Uncharacterized protein n=1 Tax=Sinorhizobium sojae CCBAU 05684 TaxID=716928 RepID=A0A249PH04_9HYPH|nr:hypothetical protein [Sinorhizobium sojae]ASY65007.1 hypothetical protein SJ05684_c35930 [Sinorhizobium sojae CCBAU 05684]
MPIVTIRNATGPGDDAAQGVRRSLPAVGQRTETVQKIVDALARHLSGEQVLSRDAVARLIDDLSRLLKSTLLPQDKGRAVARHLMAFIESLPAPERLSVEKELSRNPIQRLAAAAREAGTVPPAKPGAAPPLPAERPVFRNLPLSASAPLQNPAALAPTSADAAMLQAMLKRAFDADGEAAAIEPAIDDRPEARPDAARADTRKAENVGESRQAPTETRNPAAAEAAPTPFEDGTIETAHRTLPGEAEAGAPRASAQKSEQAAVPAAGDTSGSDPPAEGEANSDQVRRGGAERAPEEGPDGLDSDGTYGPPRAKGEGDRQQARQAATRNETAAASRTLGDAIKALAADGPGDLHKPTMGVRSEPPEALGDVRLSSRDLSAPVQPRDAAFRPRSTMTGAEPSADPAAADPPDAPEPGSVSNTQRPRQAAEDPSMQQAIALLVDSGLPKEIIPFALVPYPPAQPEAESDDREQEPQDENNEDAEAGAEDGGEGEEARQRGEDDPLEEELDAADPYDLYRKLGGLG